MVKQDASDACVQKDSKLLFKVDMLWQLIPCQLQLINEGMKYMLVDLQLIENTFGMAIK